MIRYTKEQKQFLIDNNYMKSSQELADMFNKEFGTNITKTNIKCFRGNNKLNSGLTGRFEKGQVSWNKGKKWAEYMSKEGQLNSSKTTFKKGHIPHNHRKIGSERITIDGYWEIKIREPNKWELKHRYLYKKLKGDIPKGHKVIFADGNKNNLDIDNLILVSNSEELIMNRNSLRFDDKELTKTGSIIAKVMDKTNKVKNERL